jgi:uncharacterized membrane protein YoaK (UPF0700 family)
MIAKDATVARPTGVAETPRLLAALFGLTFATGVVDAASVLGLGHVFTANMTGNVVFIGFALGGRDETAVGLGLVSLAAFLFGAMVGGRVTPVATRRVARRALSAALVALVLATATSFVHGSPRIVVVGLLALAMGLRTAVVRKLAVLDMTTTVLTLTLVGLAADSSLAGGANPRWQRRVGAVVVMACGAMVGAELLRVGLGAAVGVATGVEIGAAALLLGALG